MPKSKNLKSDSESQSEGRSNSSSESEQEETVKNGNGLSNYEEQRLQRIAENRRRLEAMGIPQMASSFKSKKAFSPPLNKEQIKDKDEDYIPEHDDREGEPFSTSSSEQDQPHFDLQKASDSQKRKMKSKCIKMKGRASGKKHHTDDDDDDEALRQAIALSLQDANNVGNTRKAVKQDKGRKNNNSKSFTSRLQMTEDEFILHFFQLDEAGKGTVTKRDLERAALAHDFVWTDKDLADMIRFFDTDRDGKLSLDDFRKIVVRCNMIKHSQTS